LSTGRRGHTPPMTDQPLDDREDAPEQPDDLQEAQEDTGYGADEAARDESLDDE
jgi:hypothetical protein